MIAACTVSQEFMSRQKPHAWASLGVDPKVSSETDMVEQIPLSITRPSTWSSASNIGFRIPFVSSWPRRSRLPAPTQTRSRRANARQWSVLSAFR